LFSFVLEFEEGVDVLCEQIRTSIGKVMLLVYGGYHIS